MDIRAPGFNLLGDHFQPIVALLAPFFRVFPSAATLLVAQALLAAASVFPVSQLAREKLGTGPGRAIAVAYGFSWGLQQLAEFDFHEIAFAVPLLAFSLSALARGRIKAAVWWALPLVFVKEDQGFTVAAIGLYLIVAGLRARSPGSRRRGRPGRPRPDGRRAVPAGLGLRLVIRGHRRDHPALQPGPHVPVLERRRGPGPRRAPVGARPGPAVRAMPGRTSCRPWCMLLLPTAFIALRSPLVLIALPSLMLRFVATDSSFWGTYWHYNATLMPIIFVAAIDALARIGAAMDADAAAAGPGWASGRRGLWRAALAGARRYGAAMMVAIAVALAFQFPLSHAVERLDLPDQPARRGGRGGHGPRA